MKNQNTHLVFVYGTLMQDGRNAHILQDAIQSGNAHFLGKDKTYKGFVMHAFESKSNPGQLSPRISDVDFFAPMMPAGHIAGELYEVNQITLEKLDELEKNGQNYQRCTINSLESGKSAIVYFKRHAVGGNRKFRQLGRKNRNIYLEEPIPITRDLRTFLFQKIHVNILYDISYFCLWHLKKRS